MGTQWAGVGLAVVCVGALVVDASLCLRRSRARRRAWSRHVNRALEVARREAEQPKVVEVPACLAPVVPLQPRPGPYRRQETGR